MNRKWPSETELLRTRTRLPLHLCEHPRECGIQSRRYASRRPNSDISFATLYRANISLMEADPEGELLLGVSLLDAEPPHKLPELPG